METENKTLEILRKGNGFKILMCLYKNNFKDYHSARIYKETKCNKFHTMKIMKIFQEEGIIEFVKKKGLKRYWKLTEKGKEISKLIDELNTLLGGTQSER